MSDNESEVVEPPPPEDKPLEDKDDDKEDDEDDAGEEGSKKFTLPEDFTMSQMVNLAYNKKVPQELRKGFLKALSERELKATSPITYRSFVHHTPRVKAKAGINADLPDEIKTLCYSVHENNAQKTLSLPLPRGVEMDNGCVHSVKLSVYDATSKKVAHFLLKFLVSVVNDFSLGTGYEDPRPPTPKKKESEDEKDEYVPGLGDDYEAAVRVKLDVWSLAAPKDTLTVTQSVVVGNDKYSIQTMGVAYKGNTMVTMTITLQDHKMDRSLLIVPFVNMACTYRMELVSTTYFPPTYPATDVKEIKNMLWPLVCRPPPDMPPMPTVDEMEQLEKDEKTNKPGFFVHSKRAEPEASTNEHKEVEERAEKSQKT